MGDITCNICGGDGEVDGGFCTDCMGTGALPVKGQTSYYQTTFDTIITKLNHIKNKVDDIWDKVK